MTEETPKLPIIEAAELRTLLSTTPNPFKIVFTKKNGEVRTLIVSTHPDYLPVIPEGYEPSETAKVRKEQNPNIVNAYSLHDHAWRSFDINSLISFERLHTIQ